MVRGARGSTVVKAEGQSSERGSTPRRSTSKWQVWPTAAPYVTPLQPCGTHAAYNRHRKRRQPACDLCVEGEAAYRQQLRDRSRGSLPARRRWESRGRDGRPVSGLCVVCGGSYVGHPVFGVCYRKAMGGV